MKCQRCKSKDGRWNGHHKYKSGITGKVTTYHNWYCKKCNRLTTVKIK